MNNPNGLALALGIALLLVSGVLPAQEPFYRDTSPEIIELRRLYSEAGRVFPQGATPISRLRLAELALDLEGPGPAALREALSLDRSVAIRAAVDTTLETYLETGEREEPFYDQYDRVDPLTEVHLSAQTAGGPALHMRFDLQREYRQNTWSNVPYPESGNPVPLENDNVRWGVVYLPLSGEDWSFEAVFGRQPVHLGPSPLGSLGPSRRLPFLDALRVNLHIGDLTMIHVVSQLENRSAPLDTAVIADDPATYGYDISRILFNTHYFEYAFDRLRLGIGAWVLASRPNNYFHLNDYFPVFSWHNAEIEPKNMCFLGDASYAFLPGLEGYVRIGFDDLRGGGVGVGDTDVPSIDAYLAGVRYWSFLGERPLVGFAEVGYTHYLWGNYKDDVALSKAIYRLNVDNGNQTLPLTSPYGPGVVWLAGSASLAVSDAVRLTLDCELLSVNTEANLFTTPYDEDDTVKNADRDILQRTTIEAAWRPLDNLELALTPGITTNEKDLRGELEISARSSFSTGGTK
ncbi:MAG: hypothetical protein ACOCW6_05400 [Spirochaetota bacterium]